MMTIAPIRSAKNAASYFENSEHAEYYSEGNVAPSEWMGGGASLLGIEGQLVDSGRLERYLNGEIAAERIGTARNGEWLHRPGWDIQLSPPKSCSVMALIGKDHRIIEAHDRAVREVLNLIEKDATYVRIHSRDKSGRDIYRHESTGNLLVARFRHESSRSLDCQLHDHLVILNASRKDDSTWKSIESRHLYDIQKRAGITYRQSMAHALTEMGYSLNREENATFEIRGIPQKTLSAFSQRTADIDRKLSRLGLDRKTASASLKDHVARSTRERKRSVDRDTLFEIWHSKCLDTGFDARAFKENAIENSRSKEWKAKQYIERQKKVDLIVERAVASLSERDSVFTREKLVNDVNELSLGYGISHEEALSGISRGEQNGLVTVGLELEEYSSVDRCWHRKEAYTTPKAVEIEQKMIGEMRRGRASVLAEFSPNQVEDILVEAEAQSIHHGFEGWTQGQKTAVRGVLLSEDRYVGIQGYAGTAKTSTALRTIAQEYRNKGYDVKGMAQSASAAQSLKDGAQLNDACTVASHLLAPIERQSLEKQQLWIVDEASLLSTTEMSKLLSKSKACAAKLVLVGDVRQLGSVDAGAAFRQLQENGLATFELKEIVRQDNRHVLNAVHQSLAADIRPAFESLTDGGGNVFEIAEDIEERQAKIVDHYMGLPLSDRRDTLLIEPSREGRNKLTNLIRAKLIEQGELSSRQVEAMKLEQLDLTRAAAKDVSNYRVNDLVRFDREYRRHQVEKGSYWHVIKVDPQQGLLELQEQDGRTLIWNPEYWGARTKTYRSEPAELAVGDRITWRENDRSMRIRNGSKGVVREIDRSNRTMEIQFSDDEEPRTISLDSFRHQHWAHDYVLTAHAAQGKTTDRVIFHAESWRRNLLSQKALYVAISRAKSEVFVYTDDKEALIRQLENHSGEKQYAGELLIE